MKILCLTYLPDAAAEKGKRMAVVIKPDTALLNGNKPFFIPHYATDVVATARLALRIGKMGRNIAEKFALRYVDGIGIGIDIAAQNLQAEACKKGYPWSEACAFDGSAPISAMKPLGEVTPTGAPTAETMLKEAEAYRIGMTISGKAMKTEDFKIDDIIAAVVHTSRFFTLHTGDLILCPTAQQVCKLNINDHIEAFLDGEKLMSFNVK